MRTTLNLDDDVLSAVKSLAASRRMTAGKVMSELVRKALQPDKKDSKHKTRNGVPLFPFKPGDKLITLEMINALRDEEE
jgi:hypothetical protein